jgi:hypothetical protein
LIACVFALNELKKESPTDPAKTSIQRMLKHPGTVQISINE